jgi:hypothetical protein
VEIDAYRQLALVRANRFINRGSLISITLVRAFRIKAGLGIAVIFEQSLSAIAGESQYAVAISGTLCAAMHDPGATLRSHNALTGRRRRRRSFACIAIQHDPLCIRVFLFGIHVSGTREVRALPLRVCISGPVYCAPPR